MGSEDSYINGPDTPPLCANKCGFYGRSTTNNLCSKCYRDYCLKQEHQLRSASVEATLDSSSSSLAPPLSPQTQLTIPAVSIGEGGFVGCGTKKRCDCCKKRVKMMGFQCRCGSTFCSEHRYPEMHACTFDFKALGRDAIAKANPVVKADKIQRF